MRRQKNIEGLLGSWEDPDILENFHKNGGQKDHKFLDRNRTIKSNWNRLHSCAEDVLLGEKTARILDVGCGNGATMEIFRYYGHEAVGLDVPFGDSHLYSPMLNSQGLKCVVHDGAVTPYPFKDDEFDLVVCWGVFNFFRPVQGWPDILDEFARITKRSIILAPNMGKAYDQGKPLIEKWGQANGFVRIPMGHEHKYRWDKRGVL
tara:strand:- start:416 stop:1030 length:615 start_codon:yes stop_codon:yes gene_type:complete